MDTIYEDKTILRYAVSCTSDKLLKLCNIVSLFVTSAFRYDNLLESQNFLCANENENVQRMFKGRQLWKAF